MRGFDWIDVRIHGLRGLPWYFWVSVLFGVALLVVAARSATSDHVDWAGFQVTLSVLVVALATLVATLPTQAKLWIDRQDELGVDDLIFFVSDEPGFGQVPRDFLLNAHLAVANVGGRKAVLSALRLDALLDIHGKEFQIPEFSLPVPAQRVRQGGGWRIEDSVFHRHSYLEFIPGPFMLEPDDVITMRLRARPGIDWSAKWTVARIGQLALSLQNPIVAARVVAIYRQGNRVVEDRLVVTGLTVLQQGLYVSRLQALTNDFTIRPAIPEHPITD